MRVRYPALPLLLTLIGKRREDEEVRDPRPPAHLGPLRGELGVQPAVRRARGVRVLGVRPPAGARGDMGGLHDI